MVEAARQQGPAPSFDMINNNNMRCNGLQYTGDEALQKAFLPKELGEAIASGLGQGFYGINVTPDILVLKCQKNSFNRTWENRKYNLFAENYEFIPKPMSVKVKTCSITGVIDSSSFEVGHEHAGLHRRGTMYKDIGRNHPHINALDSTYFGFRRLYEGAGIQGLKLSFPRLLRAAVAASRDPNSGYAVGVFVIGSARGERELPFLAIASRKGNEVSFTLPDDATGSIDGFLRNGPRYFIRFLTKRWNFRDIHNVRDLYVALFEKREMGIESVNRLFERYLDMGMGVRFRDITCTPFYKSLNQMRQGHQILGKRYDSLFLAHNQPIIADIDIATASVLNLPHEFRRVSNQMPIGNFARYGDDRVAGDTDSDQQTYIPMLNRAVSENPEVRQAFSNARGVPNFFVHAAEYSYRGSRMPPLPFLAVMRGRGGQGVFVYIENRHQYRSFSGIAQGWGKPLRQNVNWSPRWDPLPGQTYEFARY